MLPEFSVSGTRQVALLALAFFLLLTIIAFFLAANGRINNFPTYFVLLIFAASLLIDRARLSSVLSNVTFRLVLALLALLWCSALWSANANVVEVSKTAFNALLIISFVGGMLICSRELPSFAWVFVRLVILAAAVSALYSLYLHQTGINSSEHGGRLIALGRLHNPVVGALCYGLVTCFTLVILTVSQDIKERVLAILICALLIFTIWLTGSRGVWIALYVAAIVIIATHFNRVGVWSLLALAILAAGFIVGQFDPKILTEILPRAASFRPAIWMTVLQQTVDANLFFGVGVLADSSLEADGMSFDHAHSIYFSILYHAGLAGLSVLLVLITHSLQLVYRNYTKSGPSSELRLIAITSLSYASVVLFFDGNQLLTKIHFNWIVFWIPIALCSIVAQEIGREEA